MKKILIINPFGIGDVLFTTPVITALKAHDKDIEISYFVNRRCEGFVRNYPQIAKVFVYEQSEFKALYKKSPIAFIFAWKKLIDDIRREGFDVALDCSLNTMYGFMAAAAGIPQRIGFDYKNRGRFLTKKIFFEGYDDKHVIEYYLDLLKCIGIAPPAQCKPFMPILKQDIQWADQWINAAGIEKGKALVAVVPGGGASWGQEARKKRWPIEAYTDLVDKIIENYDPAIILMGDRNDVDLCQHLTRLAHFPVYNAAGQTTVTQMAALMSRCRFVIVNDGGPLHIAGASGVTTVSVFGPVDERVYGPYPIQAHTVVKAHLPCQPCYRRFRMTNCTHLTCIKDVSVDDVYNKVKGLL